MFEQQCYAALAPSLPAPPTSAMLNALPRGLLNPLTSNACFGNSILSALAALPAFALQISDFAMKVIASQRVLAEQPAISVDFRSPPTVCCLLALDQAFNELKSSTRTPLSYSNMLGVFGDILLRTAPTALAPSIPVAATASMPSAPLPLQSVGATGTLIRSSTAIVFKQEDAHEVFLRLLSAIDDDLFDAEVVSEAMTCMTVRLHCCKCLCAFVTPSAMLTYLITTTYSALSRLKNADT
jgi:hypothetical protein